MDSRADDLGQIALRRNRLVELRLGPRRDHDLSSVVHELGHPAVGMLHDCAKPMKLPVGHVWGMGERVRGGGVGPEAQRLAPAQDDLRGHHVLLVVTRFGGQRRSPRPHGELRAMVRVAGVEFARSTQGCGDDFVAPLGRTCRGHLLRQAGPRARAVGSEPHEVFVEFQGVRVGSGQGERLGQGQALVRVGDHTLKGAASGSHGLRMGSNGREQTDESPVVLTRAASISRAWRRSAGPRPPRPRRTRRRGHQARRTRVRWQGVVGRGAEGHRCRARSQRGR